MASQPTQRRPKRSLIAGVVAAFLLTTSIGIVAAVPALADDTVPDPIVTEVTEQVVEEVVTPEETTPTEETPAVSEEEVVPEEENAIEESAAAQRFSTQTAKNDGEQGQETCPDGGGWLKIEPIDALTYEYTAPDGQLIAEVCYKASTEVIYIDIEDAASYEFVSTVTNKNGELQEISHVSVRLITDDPTCVQDPTWSYTFDPATGSGVITVTGGENGEELCEPLFVRAASWFYDTPASGSPSWPQTLNGYNDTTVDKIGEFNYGPPQIENCRQYDVYASFGGYDELGLPTNLLGSHDPYEPAFLHETLNGFGPNPTYSFTSSEGCDPPIVDPEGTLTGVCVADTFVLTGSGTSGTYAGTAFIGVDGVEKADEAVAENSPFSFSYNVDLPEGTTFIGDLQFGDLYGAADILDSDSFTIDCEDELIPVEITAGPSVTAPTCDVAGTLVIPTTEHVTFAGGVNGAGPGQYTITASADEGYVLTGDVGPWNLTVLPKKTSGCEPVLAFTGGTVDGNAGALAALLVAVGAIALAGVRSSRRQAQPIK